MSLKKTLYILIATLSLVKIKLAFAQDGYDFDNDSGLLETSSYAGFYNTIFNSSDSINTVTSQIITTILSFLGVIFLVITIYAGFQWMTAGGNEEEVKKAKERLKNSIIGLVIVLAAYAVTFLVTQLLADQTLNN